MAYLAVDRDGTEVVFHREPFRCNDVQQGLWLPDAKEADVQIYVNLPKGSIKKLIGRKLTWEDEPYELKNE